jgi:hypothetical protein
MCKNMLMSVFMFIVFTAENMVLGYLLYVKTFVQQLRLNSPSA